MDIGYIFSGQGAQGVGMGASLYENSSAARRCFDEANEILSFDIKEACFEGPKELLTETRVCQPALFVHGYAVVEALREIGKLGNIAGVAGLSLGEFTAHAVAGTFGFATGVQLVAERGRLMQEACDATEGGMTSLIGGDVAAATALAEKFDVDVANLNCPGQTVISGDLARVKEATSAAKEAGFKMAVPLQVAGAYHSRLMTNARDRFKEYIAQFNFETPKLPIFTNVTGKQVSEPLEIKNTLVEQIVSSVHWEECFRGLNALGINDFYECGPGNILTGLARRIGGNVSVKPVGEWEKLQSL